MRNPMTGTYQPFISDSSAPDPTGQSRYSFLPFVYGPPTNWSDWMRVHGTLQAPTAGETAALASIVNSALANGWVPATPLCPGAPDAIRGYYCDIEPTDLSSLATRTGTLSFPSNANGFTAADFSSVQTSLISEITDVANIRAGIAQYQTLFGNETETGSVDAGAIAQTIQTQVHYATTAGVESNTWGLLQTAMTLMSADPDIDDPMTFVGGAFVLFSQVLPNTTPTPSLPNQVELTQATAASELTNDYNQASISLSNYGDYLVQDPVKLMQGAKMLSTGQYALTSQKESALLDYADYGTKQWLWGTILGTTYSVWTASTQYERNITCLYGTQLVNPFANVANSGYWGPPQHLGGQQWWLGLHYSSNPSAYVLRNNAGLGQSVTDPLFSPLNPILTPANQVNIGAAMPYFALTYLGSNPLPIQTGPGKNGCFQ